MSVYKGKGNGVLKVDQISVQQIAQLIGANTGGSLGSKIDVVADFGSKLVPFLLPAIRPIIGQMVSDAIKRQNGRVQGLGRPSSNPRVSKPGGNKQRRR